MAQHTLIICYSLTGHAREAAERIAARTGADVFDLQLHSPYPQTYLLAVLRAGASFFSHSRPELIRIPDVSAYDRIILCYPLWWWHLPAPVIALLERIPTAGKTIVPVCTSGGGKIGVSLRDLQQVAPRAHIAPAPNLQDRDFGTAAVTDAIDAYFTK
ncbi:MAG: NAD(P)H-dependent oxidoreductase [Veillonellaceae bacterium]|nr:NAD(P)H-dependent oxidoreductase [Veillonellaceae bacterium]